MKREAGHGSPGAEAAEAAATLRHDLGKAVRLSAPDAPEADTEALRARLRADVLRTRQEASGPVPASELFERWRRASGSLFADGDLKRRVEGLARRIADLRAMGERLEQLGRAELERLDALTQRVAAECRDLVTAARGAGRRS